MKRFLLNAIAFLFLVSTQAQNKMMFDAISFPANGPDAYRIFVSYDMPSAMISMDFTMDYDSSKIEVIDVDLTPDGTSYGLVMTWNDFNSKKLYVSSYNLTGANTTNALIYVDIEVQGALLNSDIDSISALLNGTNVQYVTSVNTVVSNSEIIQEKQISLYPNPSSDMLTITLNNLKQDRVKVFNSVGQLVIDEQINHNMVLDVSSFKPGVYSVFTSRGTKKFVVQ
jgi:hypothetical protein